ncbi:MAG: thiamine pyrophosphate-binding protein [Desulfobacterales bacterium]|nr:thiamine pyrophosphate-binding protein [Desulfobacterales bacterium]
MAKKIERVSKPKVVPTRQRWASDVIVDLFRMYDLSYATLNPGSSYRGLHDSIVNYGQNYPQMLQCQHEETAVQIAHGYAKASGEPMVAILHNLVGLLHATMAIYHAYIDRAPIFIVGATGPMNETRRVPHYDWIHSAHIQGTAVREFTKWDYQPNTIDGVPESFARAYGVMMTEPQGPVYMCYDALLQESPLNHDVALPPVTAAKVPSPMAPDPGALEKAADLLVKAKHPVILTEYAGRNQKGFQYLIELAETMAAPVYSLERRLNFPSCHPLNVSKISDIFTDADLIVCLDVRDFEHPTTKLVSTTREVRSIVPVKCKWVDIGFNDLELSSWSLDYQRLLHADIRILADTTLAIPSLTELCQNRLDENPSLKSKLKKRFEATRKRHETARRQWAEEAQRDKGKSPIPLACLADEVWQVIKDEDWVLTAGSLRGWAYKLWDFDKPYRHVGDSLGTATQIGISLGIALAHRGTGRLVVDLQPDGDLMFDLGALWIAAKHKIPMLVVMFNNRAYYNDWDHQIRMARQRGTPVERACIGMDISGPDPDFASVARALGWYAEGPIDKAKDVGAAVHRAMERVKAGQPALVDTITQPR